MGDYLSREDILKTDDLEVRDVEVPEWGGTVRIRAMSGTERDAYDASRMERAADGTYVPTFVNSRAKLVARSIVDDNGVLLFSEVDVVALGRKSAVALGRVFEAAAELSGLSDGDDLAGNSEAAPSGDSGSSSPAS
jgi:hypothetical protein